MSHASQQSQPVASALVHDHASEPCACQSQSVAAIPWILGAAVVLFAVHSLAARRKRAAKGTTS